MSSAELGIPEKCPQCGEDDIQDSCLLGIAECCDCGLLIKCKSRLSEREVMSPKKSAVRSSVVSAKDGKVPEKCPQCGEDDIQDSCLLGLAECCDCGLLINCKSPLQEREVELTKKSAVGSSVVPPMNSEVPEKSPQCGEDGIQHG